MVWPGVSVFVQQRGALGVREAVEAFRDQAGLVRGEPVLKNKGSRLVLLLAFALLRFFGQAGLLFGVEGFALCDVAQDALEEGLA